MRSMTGFSGLDFENENFKLSLEIKSVNNKNLNLKIKMPYILNNLELEFRKIVSSRVNRGSVDLRIDFEDKTESNALIDYDENLALSYMKVFSDMENKFNSSFSNKLDFLLKQQNILKKSEKKSIEDNNFLFDKLNELIDKFIVMKVNEGNELKKYFYEKIDILERNIEKIKLVKDLRIENYKENLIEKLNNIKENLIFSENDILKEVLIFVDKIDISEEISRLESHIKYFKEELENHEITKGKKIDFILQEIFRELNTSGVKSNSYEISKLIIDSKNELEKMREQILNIE